MNLNSVLTVTFYVNGNPMVVPLSEKAIYEAKGYSLSPTPTPKVEVPQIREDLKEIQTPKAVSQPTIPEVKGKEELKLTEKVKQEIPVKVKSTPEPDIHVQVFEKMDKVQLLKYAQQQGIKGIRSDMKREFILSMIKKYKGIS